MKGKPLDQITARGILKGGRLLFRNAKWVKGLLQLYADCDVLITIARRKKSKSKEQLGYLWGVVYPTISADTGHTPEELHDIYKTKFLRKKIKWNVSDMVIVGSTSGLTTNEMAEFITNVIIDAGDMGIEIPEPDQLYQFK